MTSCSSPASRSLGSSALALLAVPLLLLALAFAPSACVAHGYLSSPPSRQAVCARGQVSNCGPIIYEPQSVEALKGQTTCNGGIANWAQLADESKAWPATGLSAGVNSFTWTLTAVHPTASWEYYIGSTRLAIITSSATTHSVNLAGYSGRQKILAIWNIGDTANAFYSCVDVNIGGSSTSTTPVVVPTAAPTAAPTTRPTTAPTTRPTTAPTTPTTTNAPTTGTCTKTVTTTVSYTVVSGDSLSAIASRRGVTLAALLAVNPAITNPNVIYVGQAVLIPSTGTVQTPCGSASTPTTAPTTRPTRGRAGRANETGDGIEGFTDGSTGVVHTDVAIERTTSASGVHVHASAAGAAARPAQLAVALALAGVVSLLIAQL